VRSRPQSPGGIHVADLSSTADPGRVEHVVGAALRVPEQPGQPPVEGIAAALRGRPALLVLDNCEHVLAACAALARALLAGCPEARILATSREPLGLPGEQTFPVPPLSLPPAGGDLGTLLESDAVQLFLDRARLIVPDFMVDAADAPVVVEICRRLDGIPLAIEIAAARVRVLSPRQIQARLDDRLRMLTGKGDTGSRHRTLWAAFQWSYDLLEADDQRHFRSLAVFAGGWPLEATAAIWGGVDEDEALERIEQLVSKSLVTVQTRGDGEPRYRLLETLRQFAWAQLDGQGESAACRDRHLEYYLARGEQAEHELWGASQAAWLAWLDREHDNLLAALDWALARSAGDDAALRLAGSLRRFWNIRGYLSVGVRALDSALRHDPQAANRPARGRALDGVANLSLLSGDYARAREAFEASLVLHREIDGRQGIARALTGLGHVASQQHDYAAARARYEESLAVSRDTDDRQGIAAALGNLAGIAVVQGDYGAARGPMSECVELFERLGNLHNVAIGLSTLAFLDLRLGNPSSARSRLRRCLTLVRDLGATRAGAAALETAAELAHEAGAAEDAARFFAAAGHLRDSSGAPLGPDEKRQQEEIVGAVRSRLGEARFHRFWSEGETRSLAVAVEDALAWLDAAPSERA
jgi:predicted ATPase